MSNARRPPRERWLGRSFRPPHCPNRDCSAYEPRPDWRWQRVGFFAHEGRPHLHFQCFRCRDCHRQFSYRTFQADYWLKRRDRLRPIARHAVEGCGLRQTARLLGVTHATVQRHLSRAGRLALVFQGCLLAGQPRREALVLDGFACFEFSQDFPFDLNLAVGTPSWFLYGFTDSPRRRSGRMTAAQKRRRAELERTLGRPDPQAVEAGVTQLLRLVLGPGPRPGTGAAPGGAPAALPAPPRDGPEAAEVPIFMDDHRSYPRALRRIEAESAWRFAAQITSSKERRTPRNPLFPVNLTDQLLRHSQAAHRRETIAFGKRRQGVLERAALFLFWRNYVKARRERRPGTTAAMAAGVVDRPLSWAALFRRRGFPRERWLPRPWWNYYWRQVRTAILGARQTAHTLTYAF